jgi:ribosomal protein L21
VQQIGSHQFKVSPNDLIYTEKLKFADINDKLMLHKVLLLGSKSQTIVGRPHVPKAAVFAVVEEHVRKILRKKFHTVAISISLQLASIDYSILSFYLLELIICLPLCWRPLKEWRQR